MASSCRGYSKTQMCFFKILRIISSTPPFTEKQEQGEEHQEPFPTKGVGIDLNLRFSSLTESESSRSDSASATLQNSNEERQEEGFPEKSVQLSEKPDGDNQNLNNEVNDVQTASFQGRDSNCLDLLIEAARVVSGKDDFSISSRIIDLNNVGLVRNNTPRSSSHLEQVGGNLGQKISMSTVEQPLTRVRD
ncbi:hypothetical protein DEO72_LG11g2886 [Vigna unguiculata]|uniref:Uncharacterized protein n=1 Tax=Vigna unguiculata TaxID=3917 RepID=A0A4D6NTA8_VIGUN|nr:hypothetical protein DEO72_LG11g2886 [Vigna unguiculata]